MQCCTCNKWTGVILWAVIIFVLSSLPGSDLPPLFPFADKLMHCAAYLLLGLLLYNALYDVRSGWLYAIIICFVYGGMLEIYQMNVPGRSAEIGDAIANLVGAVLGVVIYRLVYRHGRSSCSTSI